MAAPIYDPSSACPSAHQFNQLLTGELDESSCDSIGVHFAQCDVCLRHFNERIAAHQQRWDHWEQRLVDSPTGRCPTTGGRLALDA